MTPEERIDCLKELVSELAAAGEAAVPWVEMASMLFDQHPESRRLSKAAAAGLRAAVARARDRSGSA